jgi:uncharacterized protein YbjT (DUF2867 family)
MIAISGASGNIGSEVVRQLAAGHVAIRALSRDPSKLKAPAGTHTAKADLLDAETLDAAFAGAEKLFLMASAMDVPRAAANAVPAAKRAGVRHIVMVSSATIAIEPEPAIGRWHREAEEVVRSSGLAWTFLRPGNFASNTLRWAGMIRSQGKVFAPAGGLTSPVDPRDIADVAVKALTTSGHDGATHVVTGGELMTPAQQLATIAAAIGRELRLVEVPVEAAVANMVRAGTSEVLAKAVVELIVAAREGREHFITTTVRDVAGHEPRTFADWVRDHVDAFRS